ncbi:SRP54-type protein [Diplocarpon rosae]|nr:SRP54-type protein [Diplocarpon rosae]
MLDSFEILTTSGVVLWSKSYAPTSPAIINSLITNVFIEERSLPGAGIADDISAANNPPYKYEQHTLKWTTVKELNIIFVAVYRSLLHLSWIDKLVDNIKTIFVDLYGDQLKKPHTTLVKCHFDNYFDQQIQRLEKTSLNQDARAAEPSNFAEAAPPSILEKLDDEPPPLPGLLSRGYPKNNYRDVASNGSSPIATPDTSRPTSADAKKAEHTTAAATGIVGSSLSAIGGLFRNVVGGKTLTKEDLDKAMKGMEDHLLRKNVAREAAIRLCEGVERELIGVKTGNFESVQAKILTAMESSLRKILTPTSSLDLLREIDAVTAPSALALQKRRPYVMSIVGVNGVGKSTNLSKICFFLLQNKYKVLVVACDTFRSGAVEQLAVHVRNLKELTSREGGEVELYQKGYGKDAANVAKDAVTFAGQEGFDVVLIDTAGRRHNDQRLMSSLEKFAKFAQPDKILMVGEALVGTDSVAQARNFNAAFGSGRSLDGFIISKCDTVGDMVGTLVSMVHATNVPVLFVGVGQHYSDLRNLSVKWAVEKLLGSH